jgi:hypothetical protein
MNAPAIDIDTLREQIGKSHSADDVAQAVIARLRDWGPAYTAAIAPELAPWNAVVRLSEFLDFPENFLPAAVVLIPGTVGEPLRDGQGNYSHTYSCLVGIVAVAKTEDDTRRVIEKYGAVTRLCLLQNSQLADDVGTLEWVSESTDNLAVSEKRHLLICTNAFTLQVDNIANWRKGPDSGLTPDQIVPWPVATEVDLTITKVS